MSRFKDLYDDIERTRPIHGWCSREKARCMADLIVKERPSVVVEIGVWGGASLLPQALACEYIEHGHVWGVDPWDPRESVRDMQDPKNIEWWGGVDHEERFRELTAALLELRLTPYCTLVRATSARAQGLFEAIDVLHIDGNHTEQTSTSDVFLYLPKVRSGGHIFFDDVDWTEGMQPTTRRALDHVEERCDRLREIAGTDGRKNCALYRKR
jgi:predicted O-methyltransferase YrrM